MYKPEAADVTGEVLKWFKSYISDRHQRVVLPGASSNWNYIRAGEQGSILGLLIFFLFIIDIVNDIGSNIRLFADDTSLDIIVDNASKDIFRGHLTMVLNGFPYSPINQGPKFFGVFVFGPVFKSFFYLTYLVVCTQMIYLDSLFMYR